MVQLRCPKCRIVDDLDSIIECKHCKASASIREYLINSFTVGIFTINTTARGTAWIVTPDGEGFEFNIGKLEKAIEKFYNDNF